MPSEVQASYIVIIDSILAASDLQTITSKRIREGLQRAVDYDISPQKVPKSPKSLLIGRQITALQDAIKALIMTRFDKFVAERNTTAETNGHLVPVKSEPLDPVQQVSPPPSKDGQKRKSESDVDEDDKLSDLPDTPPPKKKRKAELIVDEDAAFAAKLQAEENSRARPTRGGSNRKSIVVKKKRKAPKKKTSEKVKAEDDCDLAESGSEDRERKVNRSGGFHVRLTWSYYGYVG